MSIRRVVPNLASPRLEKSREFYVDVLGLEPVMDLGWIVTFASPSNPTAQVSVTQQGHGQALSPDLTVEVADVDAVHAAAAAHGYEVVYPLTDEAWGVRRFFVREPGGRVVNVMSHRPA